MKKRFRLSQILLSIVIALAILSLLAYNFFLLRSASDYFNNEAQVIAQRYALQTVSSMEAQTEGSYSGIRTIAAQLPSYSGYEQFDAFGEQSAEQYGLACLQFLKNGEAEYRYGEGVGSATAPYVQSLVAAGEFGVSRIYNDYSLGVPCVAVYCPVTGSTEADGILAYCKVLSLFHGKEHLSEFTKYYCAAEYDGSIVEMEIAEGMKTDVSHNIFTYLDALTESKQEVDPIKQLVESKVGGTRLIHIDGEQYIVSVIPFTELGSNCFVLQVFSKEDLLLSEYTLYDRMLTAFMFSSLMTVVVLVACLLIKNKDNKLLVANMETDPMLGCNSYSKFVFEATEILNHNRFSQYALIYFGINKFHFIKQHIGNDGADETLKFVSNVVNRLIDRNETYGHAFDENFVILMHYSDEQEMGERIKLMGALISNFELLRGKNIDTMIDVGVYLVPQERRLPTQQMVDYAQIALKTNKRLAEHPYIIYTPAIASSYIQEAEIEAKMNIALKNHDFKLFFQPQYGIANDRVESAEVLVRWYDVEMQTYIAPDSFISVFEANGFVADLDHYVFEEACRFLSEYTNSGEKVIPLSVNVSRATAIRDDFVNYYIKKKNEYKIADNFLTLEFTESFANESYELLSKLLFTLKKNGFRCSIDDFGMGHSSIIALKDLPFDELKLDRALLKAGTDSAKDDVILKMLINMGKGVGMKMVQEGVETLEDMHRMKDLGCDLIQGYYYAKPLPMTEFAEFINDDTSLGGLQRFRKQKKAAAR